jgi:hypothetical protein
LQKYKKENLDLKYEIQKKSNDIELKDKKLLEQESLIKELKQYHNGTPSPSNQASSLQIRQL